MKRRIIAMTAVFALSICLTGQQGKVSAAGDPTVSVAKSGNADSIEGDNKVDVEGQVAQDSSLAGTSSDAETKSSEETKASASSKSAVAKVGGTVTDTTGKSVKTGDVLASSRALTVLFVGIGFLFLVLKKRNHQETDRG